MNKLRGIIAVLSIMLIGSTAMAQDLPPNAEPGKCYAKCYIADEYQTVTEQVLAKEASSRLEVAPATFETVTETIQIQEGCPSFEYIPATFKTVEETVMVKPASKRYEVIPATYKTVEETILIKSASSRLEIVPAVYETETETIPVSSASTKWVKKKAQNCVSSNPDDCLVWCLVDVPATSRTVTREVLKTPATTREITIPAEYTTIKKKLVDTPADTRQIDVPAEYKTMTKKVIDTPASVREIASCDPKYKTITKTVLKAPASTSEITIPAEYRTISKTVLVKKGGFTEWREVLCETGSNYNASVRDVQAALKERGYEPGPVDGVMGAQTRAALLKFQRDNGLPQGQLDVQTLTALGIH
ncbi:MAG: peptidoglycan-binding protein [Bacteroidetes bacterium]|nr:peptidoglycan-binding protein [Bacteroidota bacterium]